MRGTTSRSGRSPLIAAVMLIAIALAVGSTANRAVADPGCDDVKQLCKEATARAAKCAKEEKDASSCKPLNDVRDATCTQAEIVCKPPVGEPG